MHRVELKDYNTEFLCLLGKLFLMHRVELKAAGLSFLFSAVACVPNAPCGVERTSRTNQVSQCLSVPNAPCGVESVQVFSCTIRGTHLVPNAPCGVESVELKD